MLAAQLDAAADVYIYIYIGKPNLSSFMNIKLTTVYFALYGIRYKFTQIIISK